MIRRKLKHKQKKRKIWQQLGQIAASWLAIQTLLLATPGVINAQEKEDLSYSKLIEKIEAGEVKQVELDRRTNKAKVTFQNKEIPIEEVDLFPAK